MANTIYIRTATFGLTHFLDGHEMPMSDLNGPYDLRNVLHDLKATQKRPKPDDAQFVYSSKK